jgi:hypothetical protein
MVIDTIQYIIHGVNQGDWGSEPIDKCHIL